MTEEKMISGYCRQADQARMVTVEYDPDRGEVEDVDCLFPSCVYAGSCPIGQEIAQILK